MRDFWLGLLRGFVFGLLIGTALYGFIGLLPLIPIVYLYYMWWLAERKDVRELNEEVNRILDENRTPR